MDHPVDISHVGRPKKHPSSTRPFQARNDRNHVRNHGGDKIDFEGIRSGERERFECLLHVQGTHRAFYKFWSQPLFAVHFSGKPAEPFFGADEYGRCRKTFLYFLFKDVVPGYKTDGHAIVGSEHAVDVRLGHLFSVYANPIDTG
jgi:hypothetical protein